MLNNILILSLPKNIKRKKFMNFKMKTIGLGNNYRYYDAIDGLESSEYKNYLNHCRKHSKKILVGEHGAYGCLMSYRQLFSKQKQSCLVLEDDVYFHRNFKDMLTGLHFANIFDKYDLVYFGYNNYRLSPEQIECIKNQETIMPVSNDYRFITCGTYAVWYSHKAIKILDNILQNMGYDFVKPIDHIVWSVAKDINSVIINPPLCISEIRDSDIRMPRNIQDFYKARLTDLNDYIGVSDYHQWMKD